MSLTSDDLFKKLRATKAFAVEPAHIRDFAALAISVGPDEFVERWKAATSPKRKASQAPRKNDVLSDLKKAAAQFGSERDLSSAQTANAIYRFAAKQRTGLGTPTKTALKGVPAMIDWLAKSIGEPDVRSLLDNFYAHHGLSTDTTHRLD